MTNLTDFFDALARSPRPPHRPLVVLAWAQTLDGSVAWPDGRPLAISGAASRQFTHRLRAFCDGILVGVGAVLADDPRLTVRETPGVHPQPIVLDTHLRFPDRARLLAHPRPPWLLTGPAPPPDRRQRLMAQGARVLPQPLAADGRVDLPAALAALYRRGIATLMVEGGPTVHAAFLRAGLADWLAVTIGPQLLGGLPALPPAQPMAPALRLQDGRVIPLGEDLLVWGRVTSALVMHGPEA